MPKTVSDLIDRGGLGLLDGGCFTGGQIPRGVVVYKPPAVYLDAAIARTIQGVGTALWILAFYGVTAAPDDYGTACRADRACARSAQVTAAHQLGAAALPLCVDRAANIAVTAAGRLDGALAVHRQGSVRAQLDTAFQLTAVQVQGGALARGHGAVDAMPFGIGKGNVILQGDLAAFGQLACYIRTGLLAGQNELCRLGRGRGGLFGYAAGQLLLHLHQLVPHAAGLLGLGFQAVALGLQLIQFFLFISAEQSYGLDRLGEDQQRKGHEDAEDVTRRGFEKVEERADFGQVPGIFAQHIAVQDNGGVVSVGGGAVGDEPRLAILGGGQRANLVGDSLAVVFIVAADKGDDIARLQRGGVHILCQHQVASAEIGGRHRVRQNDEHLVAKELTVVSVEG